MDNSALAAVTINGHTLPPAMVKAICERRWARKAPAEQVHSLFPLASYIDQLWLYDIITCASETRSMTDGSLRELDEVFALCSGSQNSHVLDPDLALIVGDLGVDSPIALDYRRGPDAPMLVYYVNQTTGWKPIDAGIPWLLDALDAMGGDAP